jgi:chemotaxis protein methyltransferase CheR
MADSSSNPQTAYHDSALGLQLKSLKPALPASSDDSKSGIMVFSNPTPIRAAEARTTPTPDPDLKTATPSLNQMLSEKPLVRKGTTSHNNAMEAEIERIKAEMGGIKFDAPGNTLNRATTKAEGLAEMTPSELSQLAAMIESVCGIHIDETKQYLLETRLLKMVIEEGCHTYTEFLRLATGVRQDALRPKLIDAMTTKETLWFRDAHPFETLRDVMLPELVERVGKRPIKIWSAACSTGQEAYSIAMIVHEFVAQNPGYDYLLDGHHLKILGTDVATTSITLSKMGRYDGVAMARGITPERKEKFFIQQGRAYAVNPEVKKLCEFKLANLQHDLPTQLGRDFDLIFLRNVAIYFTREFKEELYTKLSKMLAKEGSLIIGATETMVGVNTPFKSHSVGKSTVYKP